MKCPHCGQEHSNQTRICPLTGSDILSYACPRCGEEVKAGEDFCTHCGLPLSQQSAYTEGSTDRVRVSHTSLWLHIAALVVGLALLACGTYMIYRVLTSAREEIAGKTPVPDSARTAWATLVFVPTHTPTPLPPTRTPRPSPTYGPSPTPTDLIAPVYTESGGSLPLATAAQPTRVGSNP